MKTLTVLWVVFCLAACGGNLITDNIGILTSGLSVESSDGKYIGDIIGMEAPEGLSGGYGFGSTVAYLYNETYDFIFLFNLDSGKPFLGFGLCFTNNTCTFSEDDNPIITNRSTIHMWGALDPDTQYAYTALEDSKVSMNVVVKSCYDGGVCKLQDANTIITQGIHLKKTNDRIDFGLPPIKIVRGN